MVSPPKEINQLEQMIHDALHNHSHHSHHILAFLLFLPHCELYKQINNPNTIRVHQRVASLTPSDLQWHLSQNSYHTLRGKEKKGPSLWQWGDTNKAIMP
jgi:hypothetical protein